MTTDRPTDRQNEILKPRYSTKPQASLKRNVALAKGTENHESVWITINYGNVFDCQKRFLSSRRWTKGTSKKAIKCYKSKWNEIWRMLTKASFSSLIFAENVGEFSFVSRKWRSLDIFRLWCWWICLNPFEVFEEIESNWRKIINAEKAEKALPFIIPSNVIKFVVCCEWAEEYRESRANSLSVSPLLCNRLMFFKPFSFLGSRVESLLNERNKQFRIGKN